MLALLPLAAPALPLDEAGKYVAGAYIVFVVLLVVYLAIMATRVQRIEKELRELAGFAETRAEVDSIGPGRGSEDQSISVSAGPRESRGGDA
jgi:hypothetical protein